MTGRLNMKALCAGVIACLFGFTALAQPMQNPVKDVTYKLQNEYDGTNGCAVIWLPKKNIYVAAIAGNADFPIEAFSPAGTTVFSERIGFDARGIWYNGKTDKIESNAAGSDGWYSFEIDPTNRPTTPVSIFAGQYQPDFQSVGVYDYSKKQVCFLSTDLSSIECYSRKKPGKTSSITLNWNGIPSGNVNPYALGYTGVSGYDFVCLDYINRKMVFFNRSGGQTATVNVPEDAPVYDWFAFSFTNGHAFFFDKDLRTWTGYKVF